MDLKESLRLGQSRYERPGDNMVTSKRAIHDVPAAVMLVASVVEKLTYMVLQLWISIISWQRMNLIFVHILGLSSNAEIRKTHAAVTEMLAFPCATPMKHSLEVKKTSEEELQSLQYKVTCSLVHWRWHSQTYTLNILHISRRTFATAGFAKFKSKNLRSQKDDLMTTYSWASWNGRHKNHHLRMRQLYLVSSLVDFSMTQHLMVEFLVLAVVTIWKDRCWCQSAVLMSELNFLLRFLGNCYSLSFRGTSWQESSWNLLMLDGFWHVMLTVSSCIILHSVCDSTGMKLLYGRHWHYQCSFLFTGLAYEFWNVSIMWQCEGNVRLHASFSSPTESCLSHLDITHCRSW